MCWCNCAHVSLQLRCHCLKNTVSGCCQRPRRAESFNTSKTTASSLALLNYLNPLRDIDNKLSVPCWSCSSMRPITVHFDFQEAFTRYRTSNASRTLIEHGDPRCHHTDCLWHSRDPCGSSWYLYNEESDSSRGCQCPNVGSRSVDENFRTHFCCRTCSSRCWSENHTMFHEDDKGRNDPRQDIEALISRQLNLVILSFSTGSC